MDSLIPFPPSISSNPSKNTDQESAHIKEATHKMMVEKSLLSSSSLNFGTDNTDEENGENGETEIGAGIDTSNTSNCETEPGEAHMVVNGNIKSITGSTKRSSLLSEDDTEETYADVTEEEWYTLYTIHYTLYTIHYTLYTIHYTLYIIHYTLYTIHYTLYTIHYTLDIVHHTVSIVCYMVSIVYMVSIGFML